MIFICVKDKRGTFSASFAVVNKFKEFEIKYDDFAFRELECFSAVIPYVKPASCHTTQDVALHTLTALTRAVSPLLTARCLCACVLHCKTLSTVRNMLHLVTVYQGEMNIAIGIVIT